METKKQLDKIQKDVEEIKKLLTGRRTARVEINWDELFKES